VSNFTGKLKFHRATDKFLIRKTGIKLKFEPGRKCHFVTRPPPPPKSQVLVMPLLPRIK